VLLAAGTTSVVISKAKSLSVNESFSLSANRD